MKRFLTAAVLLALILCAPMHGLSEDKNTVLLARAIYAVAREDSYEAKLALGSVVMNRVDSPWYPNTLNGVLTEKHQFPAGQKYDDESLRAAHEVVTGRRTLDASLVEWSTQPLEDGLQIGGLYVTEHR
ncbi:MAG: cell wall hydrolase [Clostridia bacterium]|nr:cell wall hydrolase [Clostridia bacterium]